MLNSNTSQVAVVNQLAGQYPNSEGTVARQNQLNLRWSGLREKAEGKPDELNSARGVQTFQNECHEAIVFIEEIKRVLEESANWDRTCILAAHQKEGKSPSE